MPCEDIEEDRGSAYGHMHLWQAGGYALAVHTVGHTAMTGDRVTEVLDVERALETGREETTEGCDERGEASKYNEVDLERRVADRAPVTGELQRQRSTQALVPSI